MLFRTNYGPELESIFFYIQKYGPIEQDELFNKYGANLGNAKSSTTNMDDAIFFLGTSGLINKDKKVLSTEYKTIDEDNFIINVLRRLRVIQFRKEHVNPLDPFFMGLVDTLFIKPDLPFLNNLHSKINSLQMPLPCSEEKVNAWKRVIEYLGIGTRGFNGFLVQYSVQIVMQIINEWPEKEGPLQQFLEDHFDKYLPWKTRRGDIARALAYPLQLLEDQEKIRLVNKQDLPSKSYLGSRKIKWIAKEELK